MPLPALPVIRFSISPILNHFPIIILYIRISIHEYTGEWATINLPLNISIILFQQFIELFITQRIELARIDTLIYIRPIMAPETIYNLIISLYHFFIFKHFHNLYIYRGVAPPRPTEGEVIPCCLSIDGVYVESPFKPNGSVT